MSDLASTTLPPWFRAWEPRDTTTYLRQCGWTTANTDQEFITSGNYANCCLTGISTPCPIATACQSNTVVVYNNGSLRECATGSSCVAQTIFQTSPAAGNGVTYIVCGKGTYEPQYRTLEGANYWSATANKVGANADPTPTPSSSGQSAASAASSPTSQAAPTQSTSSLPENPALDGSISRAAIAGAAFGGVAALILISMFVWLCVRRHKAAKDRGSELENGVAPGGAVEYVKEKTLSADDHDDDEGTVRASPSSEDSRDDLGIGVGIGVTTGTRTHTMASIGEALTISTLTTMDARNAGIRDFVVSPMSNTTAKSSQWGQSPLEKPEATAEVNSRPLREMDSKLLHEMNSEHLHEIDSENLHEIDSEHLHEMDSRPLHEMDSRPLHEMDSRPLHEMEARSIYEMSSSPTVKCKPSAELPAWCGPG